MQSTTNKETAVCKSPNTQEISPSAQPDCVFGADDKLQRHSHNRLTVLLHSNPAYPQFQPRLPSVPTPPTLSSNPAYPQFQPRLPSVPTPPTLSSNPAYPQFHCIPFPPP
ncbi:hypothetical protein ACOMHN_043848 [Nucella lapillus]